jgi:putative membrane protein
LLVLAAIGLSLREILALMRLRSLDALRERAKRALETDSMAEGKAVADEMQALYQDRADLARPRQMLADNMSSVFDGAEMIRLTERSLMTSLDNRARALTAGSARRVAVVTAISPRAIVDIAFVAYESFRLARAVAELYGARPGFFGTTRLARAVLGHLAVTGGVALGDSVIQQLVGHGLAARLSARLGEGLVNGMMMVRVGIAAMRVVRPLPFEALKQPVVSDFLADLSKATATGQSGEPVPKGKA